MADVKVYDPQSVHINYLGVDIAKGIADGEFCKATRVSPSFTSSSSLDGEVTRAKTGDKRVKVELSLTQTSSINAVLSAFASLDEALPNGASVGPLMISSNNSFLFCEKAWVEQPPDMTFAKEPGNRVWKFEGVETSRLDGEG